MRPKVSVLIPAYNHGLYIGAAIESVISQTFKDFELLISDDCSTDNTKQIISSYSDKRIKTFFFDQNCGTVNALNTLLAASKGEFISVLGSDDIWLPDKLEKQLKTMYEMPEIAACFTHAEIIDSDSKPLKFSNSFPMDIFNYNNKNRAQMLCDLFLTGNHFCHSSALIRASAHKEVGNYKLQYRQLHDLDLWVRILLEYPVWIIEDKLVMYRVVENLKNVSENTNKNNIRLFNEAKYIFYDMFKYISDDDFVEGFADYFINKKTKSHVGLKCEKFFMMWNKCMWGRECKSSALDYLMNNVSDKAFFDCMQKEYNVNINDIYESTGSFTTSCPIELSTEVIKRDNKSIALSQELNSIYNSKTWKTACIFKRINSFLRRKN